MGFLGKAIEFLSKEAKPALGAAREVAPAAIRGAEEIAQASAKESGIAARLSRMLPRRAGNSGEEMVRLWRAGPLSVGESSATDNWMQAAFKQRNEAVTGRWWGTGEDLHYYMYGQDIEGLGHHKPGKPIHFMDVPRSVAEKYRVSNLVPDSEDAKGAIRASFRPEREFFLPPDMLANAQPASFSNFDLRSERQVRRLVKRSSRDIGSVPFRGGQEESGVAAKLSRTALPHFRYDIEGLPIHTWGRALKDEEHSMLSTILGTYNREMPGSLDVVRKARLWLDPNEGPDSAFQRFWQNLGTQRLGDPSSAINQGYTSDSLDIGILGAKGGFAHGYDMAEKSNYHTKRILHIFDKTGMPERLDPERVKLMEGIVADDRRKWLRKDFGLRKKALSKLPMTIAEEPSPYPEWITGFTHEMGHAATLSPFDANKEWTRFGPKYQEHLKSTIWDNTRRWEGISVPQFYSMNSSMHIDLEGIDDAFTRYFSGDVLQTEEGAFGEITAGMQGFRWGQNRHTLVDAFGQTTQEEKTKFLRHSKDLSLYAFQDPQEAAAEALAKAMKDPAKFNVNIEGNPIARGAIRFRVTDNAMVMAELNKIKSEGIGVAQITPEKARELHTAMRQEFLQKRNAYLQGLKQRKPRAPGGGSTLRRMGLPGA